MSNQIIWSNGIPVHFVELNYAQAARYRTKRMENFRFQDMQKPWDNKLKYFQKWQTTDTVKLQFQSNFDPININIVNSCNGYVPETVAAQKVRVNRYLPGYYLYEASHSWALYNPGFYHMEIPLPDRVLISEPMQVAQVWENTVLLEYFNTKYHIDIIFETGYKPQIRVEGSEGFLIPGSDNTVYEDQKNNPTILSSKPFNSFPYTYGGTRGMPDWMVNKIALIHTCNSVAIDNKYFTKPADSKWTFKTSERYKMRSMSAELREGLNRTAQVVQPGIDANKRLIWAYNIDPKVLFGLLSTNASSEVIRVVGTE